MQTHPYLAPHNAGPNPPRESPRKLARATEGRRIGGVCAGLGEFYRIDPIIARIAFVVAGLAGFAGVVLYGLLWALLPVAGQPGTGLSQAISRVRSGQASKLVLALIAAVLLLPTVWAAAVVAAILTGYSGDFNAVFGSFLLLYLAAFGGFLGWLVGGYGQNPPLPGQWITRHSLLAVLGLLCGLLLGAPLLAGLMGVIGMSVSPGYTLGLALWTLFAGLLSWLYFTNRNLPAAGAPQEKMAGCPVAAPAPDPRSGLPRPAADAAGQAQAGPPRMYHPHPPEPAPDADLAAAAQARAAFDTAAAERASESRRAAEADAAARAARRAERDRARQERRDLRAAQRAQRKHRNRWGRLTAALALIAAGGLALLDAAGQTALGYTGIGIVVLGILAAGILTGAWFGSARWLIAPALALAVVLGSTQTVTRLSSGPAVITQLTVIDQHQWLNLPPGNNVVDLTALENRNFPTLEIRQFAGELTVLMPADPTVHLSSKVALGRNLARDARFGTERTFSNNSLESRKIRVGVFVELGIGTLNIKTVKTDQTDQEPNR
ncbi:MAG: PspC domain-containing protein [Candidatus Nanopelagicales bacterium]